MVVDATSLLIAIAFSSASLTLALLIGWLNARTETYLLFSAAGVALVVLGVLILGGLDRAYDFAYVLVAFTSLLAGFSLILAAARHFRDAQADQRLVFALFAGLVTAMATFMLFGLSGIGTLIFNVAAGLLMAICAYEYWRATDQPRLALVANSILYGISALSFVACSWMIVIDGQWVLTALPDNWAEDLNSIISLVGLTGIGAITLTLHHARAVHHHHTEANTDSLTGVLNRRALFDRFGTQERLKNIAVLMFDLDHFKQINDHYGHAEGDRTLQIFADVLRQQLRRGDVASRIGGEEFCVVLHDLDQEHAKATAERIRTAYADLDLTVGDGGLLSTVSVGLAMAGPDEDFSALMNRADAALYQAKNSGRNQVRLAPLRLVA